MAGWGTGMCAEFTCGTYVRTYIHMKETVTHTEVLRQLISILQKSSKCKRDTKTHTQLRPYNKEHKSAVCCTLLYAPSPPPLPTTMVLPILFDHH